MSAQAGLERTLQLTAAAVGGLYIVDFGTIATTPGSTRRTIRNRRALGSLAHWLRPRCGRSQQE